MLYPFLYADWKSGRWWCSLQCWLNCNRAAHSTSLERKGKLLTGLKFLSSRSSPFFFRSGLTIEIFHSSQKQALLSEVLMMWVMTEMRTGSIHFNTFIGIGSNLQLLVCMSAISLVTWMGMRGANFLKLGYPLPLEQMPVFHWSSHKFFQSLRWGNLQSGLQEIHHYHAMVAGCQCWFWLNVQVICKAFLYCLLSQWPACLWATFSYSWGVCCIYSSPLDKPYRYELQDIYAKSAPYFIPLYA